MFKKIFTAITLSLALLVNIPVQVMAADDSHYELRGWKMNVTGGTPSVNFFYVGKTGTPLNVGLAMDSDMVTGHENDPSWTGMDSVAPLLAYIKKYGINSYMRENMNPTYFDPSILKSAEAQGVSLGQLGANNPQVGQALVSETAFKNIVGLGISAPDLSSIGSKPTPQPVVTASTEPAKLPTPKTEQSNTTQSTQSTDAKSDPTKTDGRQSSNDVNQAPVLAAVDPKPMESKIPDPNPVNNQETKTAGKTNPIAIIGVLVAIAALVGVGVFVYKKHHDSISI